MTKRQRVRRRAKLAKASKAAHKPLRDKVQQNYDLVLVQLAELSHFHRNDEEDSRDSGGDARVEDESTDPRRPEEYAYREEKLEEYGIEDVKPSVIMPHREARRVARKIQAEALIQSAHAITAACTANQQETEDMPEPPDLGPLPE